jgi:Uncharacterised protein family (UPF0158)
MERFIATCQDSRTVDRLSRAIDGKGAFKRFRIAVESWPELENSWYRFDEERWRGRAREFLADAGYRAARNPFSSRRLTTRRVIATAANPCPTLRVAR